MHKRDIFILPLIVVMTVICLVVPAEFTLRKIFPAVNFDSCVDYKDLSAKAFHARPGCISRMRVPESPWVEMKYNACGFRSAADCDPKKKGALRVAVVGSSLGAGFLVPYPQTVTAIAGAELQGKCNSPIDLQNLSAEGNVGERLYASARAATELSPDTLIFIVSPTDLQLDVRNAANAVSVNASGRQTNLMREIKAKLSSSRLFYMESYLIMRSDANFVPMYLASGHNADFMRAPLSTEWQTKVQHFEDDVTKLSEIARDSNVPFLVIFVPQRAEAAVAASPSLGKGVDSSLLPNQLRNIVLKHGAQFADMTTQIAPGTSSSTIYYAMNGHLNGSGHGLLAKTLVNAVVDSETAPLYSQCRAPKATSTIGVNSHQILTPTVQDVGRKPASLKSKPFKTSVKKVVSKKSVLRGHKNSASSKAASVRSRHPAHSLPHKKNRARDRDGYETPCSCTHAPYVPLDEKPARRKRAPYVTHPKKKTPEEIVEEGTYY